MKTCVITVVAGRHEHLRHQLRHLTRSAAAPDQHLVVSMGDPRIADIVSAEADSVRTVSAEADSVRTVSAEADSVRTVSAEADSVGTVWVPAGPGPLPLARARNVGATAACERGAELLVFLDVDCLPHPRLLDRYRDAAAGRFRDGLLCGPVTYLSATDSAALHHSRRHSLPRPAPHPARPAPADGIVEPSDRYELFWSLSFALRTATWTRVGGFCEDYTGYGGEDTDFAQSAAACGVGLAWVGGAHAYHQHHDVSDPPVEHLDDIVRNATVFHRRWGWWPMQGWLHAFESRGLACYDATSDAWTVPSPRSSDHQGAGRRGTTGHLRRG